MMRRLISITLLVGLAACSSSSTDDKTPGSSGTSGSPGSSGSPSGETSSGAGGEADAGAQPAALKAPKIDSIMKMSGALHVTWTNNDTTCDGVEGERQAQAADGTIADPYKVVFKLPAAADNKHDTTATQDMKYTYRIRCRKGTTYSAYSNEMSANPVK